MGNIDLRIRTDHVEVRENIRKGLRYLRLGVLFHISLRLWVSLIRRLRND